MVDCGSYHLASLGLESVMGPGIKEILETIPTFKRNEHGTIIRELNFEERLDLVLAKVLSKCIDYIDEGDLDFAKWMIRKEFLESENHEKA